MWTKEAAFVIIGAFALCAQGDSGCTSLSGTCQTDSIACPGGYRSYLCNGPSNRRCCLPDDSRCTAISGTCQTDSLPCPGGYQSYLCGGGSNRRCCRSSPSGGGGWVDYRGYTITDNIVKQKLEAIADLFGKRLWVTSGDRNWGTGSHHDYGRAADFWVDGGLTGGQMFDRIRTSGILARDFQVIWHGTKTCTGGQHLHIGRYGDNRSTCWVHEGTTSSNVCDYICM